MKTLKYFSVIVNAQTMVVTLLALASTWACLHFDWAADIPAGLIGLAVVFPIVFSINAAYRRREEALRYYSGIKAHGVALYLAHRDWVPGGVDQDEHAQRARALIQDLLRAIQSHFDPKHGRSRETFRAVYAVFSRFSASHEQLRAAGIPPGEISRMNQFASKMAIDFEKMCNIMRYRTPLSLRAYSQIFLNAFPVIFGPYFAQIAMETEKFPAVGYVVAATYSLVLVSLDNIQEDLEDPYDGVGTDDVDLAVTGDYAAITAE